MTDNLQALLDLLPSDKFRQAFEGVSDRVAEKILNHYHFVATADEREAAEEFFEEGGPDLIRELISLYQVEPPPVDLSVEELEDIWDLPSFEK